MSIASRINYWRRLFAAYRPGASSQLSFWHDVPTRNKEVDGTSLGRYYMRFDAKASYKGDTDDAGVPMLNYHGNIGTQYNPISIAQHSLGNHTLWNESGSEIHLGGLRISADWLQLNLEQNEHGIEVWMHKFDWEYVSVLRAPWYSGLAQGQGISALLRAHKEFDDQKYLDAAERAFVSLTLPVSKGGVLDESKNDCWIEEYIVESASHILNGFMWATWGLWDYWLATSEPIAKNLWERCVETLLKDLHLFDTGYWSLYDLSSNGRLKMLASPFYHRLHIVQLEVIAELTGLSEFRVWSQKFRSYEDQRLNHLRARAEKVMFKLLKY